MLTALRLMLITKSATQIALKPASEEDLESDLEPATPGRMQPSANMADGYKLEVQVKLRGGHHAPFRAEAYRRVSAPLDLRTKSDKFTRPWLAQSEQPCSSEN